MEVDFQNLNNWTQSLHYYSCNSAVVEVVAEKVHVQEKVADEMPQQVVEKFLAGL